MINISATYNLLSSISSADLNDSSFQTVLFRSPPAIEDFKSRLRAYQDSYLYLNAELVEGVVPTTPQRLEHIKSVFADWVYTHRDAINACNLLRFGVQAESSATVSFVLSDHPEYSKMASLISAIRNFHSSGSPLSVVLSILFRNITGPSGHGLGIKSRYLLDTANSRLTIGVVGTTHSSAPGAHQSNSTELYLPPSSGYIDLSSRLVEQSVTVSEITTAEVSMTNAATSAVLTSLVSDASVIASIDESTPVSVSGTSSGEVLVKVAALRPHIRAIGYCILTLAEVGLSIDPSIVASDMVVY